VIVVADNAKNPNEVQKIMVKGILNPQLITMAFERKGKGNVTYFYHQYTKTKARYLCYYHSLVLGLLRFIHRAEIVQWVSKSKRPFSIVEDHGFQALMKTGRPGYYIPSVTTICRDLKKVFVNVCKQMAKMLQVHVSHNLDKAIIDIPQGT
jgi:hypothetical protein